MAKKAETKQKNIRDEQLERAFPTASPGAASASNPYNFQPAWYTKVTRGSGPIKWTETEPRRNWDGVQGPDTFHIKCLPSKNKANEWYYVNMNKGYLGCDNTIEAAKKRCDERKLMPRQAHWDDPGFRQLVKEQADATAARHREHEAAMARKAVNNKALANAGEVERPVKAVKVERAPRPPRGEAAKGSGIIRLLTKTNPRKAGTRQHAYFELIMKFDGRPDAEYLKAPGAKGYALKYAQETGHVKIEVGK